jgi:hypothetical protein
VGQSMRRRGKPSVRATAAWNDEGLVQASSIAMWLLAGRVDEWRL